MTGDSARRRHLVFLLMRTDQRAEYPVGVTAATLSCVFRLLSRWNDAVTLVVLQ